MHSSEPYALLEQRANKLVSSQPIVPIADYPLACCFPRSCPDYERVSFPQVYSGGFLNRAILLRDTDPHFPLHLRTGRRTGDILATTTTRPILTIILSLLRFSWSESGAIKRYSGWCVVDRLLLWHSNLVGIPLSRRRCVRVLDCRSA